VALQDRERASCRRPGQPRYELPMIPEGIDLAACTGWPLASREQGAA
jgi:hypothetical protein